MPRLPLDSNLVLFVFDGPVFEPIFQTFGRAFGKVIGIVAGTAKTFVTEFSVLLRFHGFLRKMNLHNIEVILFVAHEFFDFAFGGQCRKFFPGNGFGCASWVQELQAK